ncbi:hypothetical protein [Streptomyces sp. WMMB303]|uniref:hypothetical protein n=1 Tax=Streptomyces sp. WMMB303 TaxID=3034154 RepID=UPI0023ECD1F2|nr:hypothetical protein [Streptomyces sp. WMMB303]MDF4250277.1 hypothetical protein [Streptomyces sp. WMMB303]
MSERTATLDVEQAELALVQHYGRLVRLAYCVLEDGPRRAPAAHAVTCGALPRRCTSTAALPHPRAADEDPVYVWLRLRVLRAALDRPRGPRLPRSLPRGGAPARAAYALRHLERMADPDIRRLLRAAHVRDPDAALARAGTAAPATDLPPAQEAPQAPDTPGGPGAPAPASGPRGQPCPLCGGGGGIRHALDTVRRRRQRRRAGAAVLAALVCCGLLGVPGDSWGPDAAARPPLVRGSDAEHALDPGALVRAREGAWRRSSRTDFGAWPARGALTRDESLLRRALVTWARPRADVRVEAAPGTPKGPPPGPPQLLYAGRLAGTAVVLLYDGLRVARYTEPLDPDAGSAAAEDGVSLQLARTAGARTAESGALVVTRRGGEVRFLTAPWITRAARVDLLDPADGTGRTLSRGADGVTGPLPLPVTLPRHCESWPGLALRGSPGAARRLQLYTDLGELAPARLTDGAERTPATDAGARRRLARTACHFPAVLDRGVRAVNSWQFARQRLPDGDGEAAWVCTRAATWRGTGARVMTQFQPPAGAPGRPGAVTSRLEDSRVCGPHARAVLTGLLWRSTEGRWYVLAAGDEGVSRLRARGEGLPGGPAEAVGNTLAVRAGREASVRLAATRGNGTAPAAPPAPVDPPD